MDHLQKFTSQVRSHVLTILFINNVCLLLAWWLGTYVLHLGEYWVIALLIGMALLLVVAVGSFSTDYLTRPLKLVWQAILHIAPDTANVPAPNLTHEHLGRELITSMVAHVYQLASVAEGIDSLNRKQRPDLHSDFIANSLPLPLIVLDKNETILFANDAMLKYIHRTGNDTIGQNVYSVLDLAFNNEHTFDHWLHDAKANKPVATQRWERVRMTIDEKQTILFDMASYYNKNNPQGFETMIVLFDHTDQYSQDDQAMSFVALVVHELRTPLTLLRGYIEAFQEELQGKLDPELDGFMSKMSAASQQLATFVNNILNVARIENDQLELQLHEENWNDIVKAAVDDMSLRAEVRGIKLKLDVAPNLPTVGVDRVSIYEVITNLIDNAIKYSGSSKEIEVKAYLAQDGRVETAVQDFGVGVPAGAIDNLFDKFYRNHRNRSQIGGTGLGLYLSKAIVDAQGGQIWVRSKEGEGSTFGFTVLPYSHVTEAQKNGQDQEDIVRGAHGWIKNHSLYRR
ncbi:MAG TPA: ATP-binding protein [Candidatus Saccharimonadales bacterium]|jgi:signal transduction histidine kinase|nr:ATP-binding protein [Candidatus Saccharimonadales bacterium]